MSTTKTIKIQKNKILSYSINKTGFQTVNKSVLVTEDMTINENMVNQESSPISQLGDRLLGISTFFMYFTPSGTYDVDSLKFISARQTTGTGLTNISVVKSLWLAQIETALSVETPRGTSKNFVFTFNGSTWDLTGATTVSGISTSDLNNVYGITFTGTASSGNVITVTETHYNKFGCYVLDANYRGMYQWSTITNTTIMPKQYSSDFGSCIESASYFNDYIKNNANLDNYPIFNYCKNLGKFILPNNIAINPVVPNGAEVEALYTNRVTLDSFDPIIQSGTTQYNLTQWNENADTAFGKAVWSCLEYSTDQAISFYYWGGWGERNPNEAKLNSKLTTPIFEVPVM